MYQKKGKSLTLSSNVSLKFLPLFYYGPAISSVHFQINIGVKCQISKPFQKFWKLTLIYSKI